MKRVALAVAALVCALAQSAAADAGGGGAPAASLRIAPSFDGHVGAWLLDGPFKAASRDPLTTDPPGVDEHALAPTSTSAAWKIASSGGGAMRSSAILRAVCPGRGSWTGAREAGAASPASGAGETDGAAGGSRCPAPAIRNAPAASPRLPSTMASRPLDPTLPMRPPWRIGSGCRRNCSNACCRTSPKRHRVCRRFTAPYIRRRRHCLKSKALR